MVFSDNPRSGDIYISQGFDAEVEDHLLDGGISEIVGI